MERWLPVAGFPGYEVSDLGRVRSYLRTGGGGLRRSAPKLLTPVTERGYKKLELWRDGALVTRRHVHRMVLDAFVGPRKPGFHACHWNGVRDDNRLENLRWGTPKDNAADKERHGRTSRGERHHTSRLTLPEVSQIRAQRGFLSIRHLAAVFDVSPGCVQSIQQGLTWRSI